MRSASRALYAAGVGFPRTESIAAIGKNLGELGVAIGQGVWDGLTALGGSLGRFAFDLFFLWPLEGTIKVLNAVTGH